MVPAAEVGRWKLTKKKKRESAGDTQGRNPCTEIRKAETHAGLEEYRELSERQPGQQQEEQRLPAVPEAHPAAA